MKMYIDTMGDGPNLVLLHGWGLNGAVWQEIIPLLQSVYRLHIVDLPGFGFSRDAIISDYALKTWSETVLSVLPEQFHLLGWSMGGLIALRMALDHPERINKLILTCSTPCFLQKELWPGIKPEVLTGFHQALQQNTRKTVERFLAIQAMGSESVREDVKRLKEQLQQRPEATPAALDAGLTLLESVDLRSEITSLECPLLSMYGRLDSLVPVAAAESINALIPDSRSVIFSQAAHTPFISHPQLFAEALRTFLD